MADAITLSKSNEECDNGAYVRVSFAALNIIVGLFVIVITVLYQIYHQVGKWEFEKKR